MKKILIPILLIASCKLYSQELNLIPGGQFQRVAHESRYDKFKDKTGNWDFLNYAVVSHNFTTKSSSFFISDSLHKPPYRNVFYRLFEPYSGSKFRNLIQVKLSDTLVTNKKYKLSYRVRVIRNATRQKNSDIFSEPRKNLQKGSIEFYLHKNNLRKELGNETGNISNKRACDLPLRPIFSNSGNLKMNELSEWKKQRFEFTAKGGERFLIIGHQKHIYNMDLTLFLDSLCLTPLPEINSENFSPIYFELNSFKLSSDTYKKLETLLKELQASNNFHAQIVGYCDQSGNEKNNKMLSHKRAKEVYQFLISKGISQKQLSFKGAGSIKSRDIKAELKRKVEIIINQL